MKKRIFIERKNGFDIERNELISELKANFQMEFTDLRYLIGYDIFDLKEDTIFKAIHTVLGEPNKDNVLNKIDFDDSSVLAFEYLPGQFDQRADSAIQCIKLIDPHENPTIYSFTLIIFNVKLEDETLIRIKNYLINKVESREKNLGLLEKTEVSKPKPIPIMEGFTNTQNLEALYLSMNLAMSLADFKFIQEYFKQEQRDPTETEIRVLDTYWSDHCRHTTFETHLKNITFSNDGLTKEIEETFKDYLETRKLLGRENRPITLMDIATINAKYERHNHNLEDLEISEEINAASIHIDVMTDNGLEAWLLMFKNETHNHPTEIEPFGGASTCIGGAIRDPLSGRSYVYQAMRITGAGDITENIDKTLEGKLPQRKISKLAAHGYSSYGNQIGLATSFVDEIYHPGYVAKRMEVGAVVGAAKKQNVVRISPAPGDIVILLGGRTGRDGIGGATGSSKTHNDTSLETSYAEVQKGNAPEERKIQRLFRNPEVTKIIKKSNDFGAGGVSVAVGELARGISIDLNKVPTKYLGINGTELAISESQERMAVVVASENTDKFISLCHQENIEATAIATITGDERMRMTWNGNTICDISRDFIDTSGVRQSTDVKFDEILSEDPWNTKVEFNKENLLTHLRKLNISENQGLVEMFDSTIGKTTVLAPYGGKHQLTKTQTSVHKIPMENGDSSTVSMLSHGFNPYISSWSPYHGSALAIVEAMSKIVSSGGKYQNIRFTFQEYFERMSAPEKWSKPLSSLLGAYKTLKEFKLAAIGGKDSMSGTYNDLHVPPTLIAFAVDTEDIKNIISPEFKSSGNHLYLIKHQNKERHSVNHESLKINFDFITKHIHDKSIISAYALGFGGLSEALVKCSFGNNLGVSIETDLDLFCYDYGSILVESTQSLDYEDAIYLGKVTDNDMIRINDIEISIKEALTNNQKTFKDIYPVLHEDPREIPQESMEYKEVEFKYPNKINEVKVLLPIFPGTNCEYDSASAFKRVGATIIPFVFNNQTEADILASTKELARLIQEVQIIMFSGGFSSGDEPDGSGKFIANVLRNNLIKDAIHKFLDEKNLILGICNGFQALTKSGLLPYGSITDIKEQDPILFKNTINRHISKLVKTKVSSLSSPWLHGFNENETHMIPISHGEGKFIVDESTYSSLKENHQIAFQYVDDSDNPTYDPLYNPNGSSHAIEGIISKDGLILGKMGHSERYEDDLYKNIPNLSKQNIFENAINYFLGKE